jgi:hypothetical protein
VAKLVRNCLERALIASAAFVGFVSFDHLSVFASPVSASFTVTGTALPTATYALQDLKALPAVTQTDSFQSGSSTTPQTHTYTGTSLWGLVNSRGLPAVSSRKNDVLRDVVVATGSDGYKVAYSAGELNPSFGNRADLVVYSEVVGGVPTSLGADGFARTTAPGDVKGGRYVSNLTNINVVQAPIVPSQGGGSSTTLSLSGLVLHPGSFDLASLEAMPTVTETVGSTRYTGVLLWDFLNAAGLQLSSMKNDVLSKYLLATGSDGYEVAFSLGELNPSFGNQPDIIAFMQDGQPLTSTGFARLVIPNDAKQGRWVSNLVDIRVLDAVTAVPEPSTWAMLILGFAGIGVMAFCRGSRASESIVAQARS